MSQESALAASHIRGCIGKSTASRSRTVIVLQYLALVRSQLEHCALLWSPQFQRNTEKLKRIQRGAMKMMRILQNLTWRKVEEIWFAHSRGGKALGGCSHSVTTPEMQLQRRWRYNPHEDAWGCFKGNVVWICEKNSSLWDKHWTRLSTEVVECLSMEILKAWPDRALGNLIIKRACFQHKAGPELSFRWDLASSFELYGKLRWLLSYTDYAYSLPLKKTRVSLHFFFSV